MSEVTLLSLPEYNALPPRQQGFVSYMQASRHGSALPDLNEYEDGTPEHEQWKAGRWAAYIACLDMED